MLSSLSSGLYRSTAMSLLFSRARLTDSSSDRSRVGRSGDVGGGDGRGAAGSWARAPAGRPNDAAKINVAIARLVRSMSERPPPFAGRASQTSDYSRGSSGRPPIIRRSGLQTRSACQKIRKSHFNRLNGLFQRGGRGEHQERPEDAETEEHSANSLEMFPRPLRLSPRPPR